MNHLEDVAAAVCKRWKNLVAGEYVPPPCPPRAVLHSLLQIVNYAAGFPEEGRYPKFNVTATRVKQPTDGVWRFVDPRPLTVPELRRLIPATDHRKSAIHVEWNSAGSLRLAGVHDLGTSWHRAREGLSYHYSAPPTLFIEVERPNRLNIYQGAYRIAAFADGEADLNGDLATAFFLHESTRGGLLDLASRIKEPEDEPIREYDQFQFLALWNCYAAIANTISSTGHGGALVILPSRNAAETPLLRRKYRMNSTTLSDAFVDFINARHESANLYYLQDLGTKDEDGNLARLDSALRKAFDRLVESTRTVAHFAQCDGAVVISRSLEVLGFGAEIAADLRDDTVVLEIDKDFDTKPRALDVEQFGMRHRSAVKFASQCSGAVLLVVSQDGPISGIWGEAKIVRVRKGVRLVNMNLPWA